MLVLYIHRNGRKLVYRREVESHHAYVSRKSQRQYLKMLLLYLLQSLRLSQKKWIYHAFVQIVPLQLKKLLFRGLNQLSVSII